MEAAGLVIGLIALAAIAMAVLLPFFVAAISSRMWNLVQESKQQTELLKKLKAETEKSNALSRQLLRAYGQDPQA
jgi:NAD/NADP transhydrogenase alpha subunit